MIKSIRWPFGHGFHLRVGVDVGVGRVSARTIESERGKVVSIDQGIVREDGLVSSSGKSTEPGSEPGGGGGVRADVATNRSYVNDRCANREIQADLRFGVGSVSLSRRNCGVQKRLPGRRAAHEGGPLGQAGRLIFAAGNGQISGDAGGEGRSLGSLSLDEFNLVVLPDDVEDLVGLEIEGTGPGGSKIVPRGN